MVSASLDLTDRVNDRVGAILERFDESALAASRSAEINAGPLAGLPLGVKANIALGEAVPTAQSQVFDADFHRGRDAKAIAPLRAAGGVFTGTTTMVEHAAGRPDPAFDFPIPRNPWNLSRWPGGSSCGTAIAVSLGIISAGLGTDTSGSCRIPAAYCGVTGMRPVAGSLPMDGIMPAAPSLDIVGPIARSARDCRLLLEVMRGDSVGSSRRGRPVSVLVPKQVLDEPRITHDTTAAFDKALTTLEVLGVETSTVDVPFLDELIAATFTIMVREMYKVHSDRLAPRWNDYGRSFRRLALAGALISDDSYQSALSSAEELRGRLSELVTDGTALALPTWPSAAPPYVFRGGAPQDDWNLTAAFCATGNPALAVPMGFDEAGLPLSLQLVGSGPGATGVAGEDTILTLGELYQQHTDHHLQVPDLDLVTALPPIPDPDDGVDPSGEEPQLPPQITGRGIPLTRADEVILGHLLTLLGAP
ncbi:amidase [Brevibacterium spongiae]|uniref:Amidase n=1 Tax=Brevibacterium spongiae TaxID=2909672 RepID=A0ABY5SKS6_9MICO|nr:amidase [Brevibacterium spongiae]UVI34739.1 amidase [Brevibacterium spongiae]